jgi:hypothetical protein
MAVEVEHQWQRVVTVLFELLKVLPSDINNALLTHPNKAIRFTAQAWKNKTTIVADLRALDKYPADNSVYFELFDSLPETALDVLCNLPNTNRGSVIVPVLRKWREMTALGYKFNF